MDSRRQFSFAGRGLLYCGAFVLTVAGLRTASTVVIPLLLAVFITIVCVPILNALQRRMPFPAAFGLVMLMLIGMYIGFPIILGGSLQRMLGGLPVLQQQLRNSEAALVDQLQRWHIDVSSDELMQALNPALAASWLGGFLNGLLNLLRDGIVVLIMVAFMLTEVSWFSLKLSLIDRGSGDSAQRVAQILLNVRRYIAIKTGISIATGLCIWLGLLAMGVEYALVWGFIAFLFNYIPTIGSVIAGIPPVILALVQHGLGMAAGVSVLYLAVNQVWGSVVEPRFQGRGLGLSPLIVFISLVFWGWVFGPVGMLLSAPLTMIVKIALEEHSDTHWIAILLGGKPERGKERGERAPSVSSD